MIGKTKIHESNNLLQTMPNKIELNGATVEVQPATQYCIRTEKYSYGIFCITEQGDLFLNSDWGFYGYAWRHFGKNFKEFLIACNAEYVFYKFEGNYQYMMRKKFPKHVAEPVKALFKEFQNALKKELFETP